MNSQEMFTSINKGVPNYILLEINTNTLINECSSNKDELENELSLLRELYRENIFKIAGYSKAKEFFFDSFRLITSYQTAETKIYISPIPFLKRLKEILNISNDNQDFNSQELYDELKQKVEELGQIATPEMLKAKFPLIYKDYELSITSYSQIKRYECRYPKPRTREIQDTINRQYRLYRNFGLHTDFYQFIKRQHTLYRNLSARRQFIEGYANRNPIDFSMFTGLDKEKFELYLADKYLTYAINTNDDREKQECIYYLATYIRETKVSNIIIKNDQGKDISFSKLVRRYKKFLQQNPIIRPIDEPRENFEGYHIKHVENHVKKYFFTNVNWQIVPPGTDEEIDRKVISTLNRQYNYLAPEERKQKILERYSIYERKKRFFENSGYVHKFYGSNTFDGYIAFIYPNGEVLMEKFFDDYAHCLPTKDEAIYNVSAVDFERLSKLSKLTLIRDKKCKRIIHAGKWEEKGQAVIDRPTTTETQEEVKRLIIKLQTKKTD